MDLNATVEQHPITLPSRGFLYGGKMPGGELFITPWTVAQEEAILRLSESRSSEVMHSLVMSNTVLPSGFDYGDLLSSDQFFLLVSIRALSLLPTMDLPHECPSCGNAHLSTVQLGELIVRDYDEDTYIEEPVKIRLPKSKVLVGLRFARVGDELKADDYTKRKTGLQDVDTFKRKFRYARSIVSLDDQSISWEEKLKFVETLSIVDLHAMKHKMGTLSSGYTGLAPAVKCPSCGHEDEMWEAPIHYSFFRLSASDIENAIRDD